MRLNKWLLKAVVILAGLGWTGLVQQAMARPLKPSVGITIHIYNYANVSRHTLDEAEKVAAKIFRNAGLQTQWVDDSEASKPESKEIWVIPHSRASRTFVSESFPTL